ncbi:MAG: hypothetical protein HKN17_02900 [Rhodothermales bacterium]|nr:hypothetical protein [Rhodothermales bacterium]
MVGLGSTTLTGTQIPEPNETRKTLRLATIDVGTNTALMLVSEWVDGRLAVYHDTGHYVRLGQGVDASGRISDAALERLERAFEDFARQAAEFGAEHIIVTGTSASRDAANPEDLDRTARAALGVEYTILSGLDEAEVSFMGAVAGIKRLEADLEETHAERLFRSDVTHRATIIDVGGGSTEVVQGTVLGSSSGYDVHIERSVSMNIGSVRMTERHFDGLPPSLSARAKAETWLSDMLEEHLAGFHPTDLCIGSSGTPRILAHLHTGVENLMDVAAGCPKIPSSALADWSERLLALPEEEVLALDARRMKGRSDVFPAAALILRRVFERVGTEALAVSSQGVRHGVAIRYFQQIP